MWRIAGGSESTASWRAGSNTVRLHARIWLAERSPVLKPALVASTVVTSARPIAVPGRALGRASGWAGPETRPCRPESSIRVMPHLDLFEHAAGVGHQDGDREVGAHQVVDDRLLVDPHEPHRQA